MAKAHRGPGIRGTLNRSRGECPVCKRTGIKVVYEHELDGTKKMVCKQCNATMNNAK